MMVRRRAREYDELIKLKTQVCEKVTAQNAEQMLEDAKNKIMKKLQKLDVRNVTAVENLYLIVAQLTQAAADVAAQNKMRENETSFDEAIQSIGVDDIAPILFNAFKDHPQAFYLHKINAIDAVYRPSKQAWAALHARMVVTANAAMVSVLKATLTAYKNHLENKLKENKADIPLLKEISGESSPLVQKMVIRYQALVDLEERIKDQEILSPKDMEFAKEQIKKCLNNNPDWTERPFLQKLTDVLSFGFKPLYRVFFSKEKKLQKTIEQFIETPKKIR